MNVERNASREEKREVGAAPSVCSVLPRFIRPFVSIRAATTRNQYSILLFCWLVYLVESPVYDVKDRDL